MPDNTDQVHDYNLPEIDGIRILPGSTDVLVIAPHGPFQERKSGIPKYRNDFRTGLIAEAIHKDKRLLIVPFNENIPPYIIKYQQGQKLIDALTAANSGIENTIESDKKSMENYVTDDGHIVKSLSEAFIDNWLFSHNILHAYPFPVHHFCKRYTPSC
jgi:hypothetical protein